MSAKRKKDIEEKYTTDRQEKVELFRQIENVKFFCNIFLKKIEIFFCKYFLSTYCL